MTLAAEDGQVVPRICPASATMPQMMYLEVIPAGHNTDIATRRAGARAGAARRSRWLADVWGVAWEGNSSCGQFYLSNKCLLFRCM